MKGLYVYGALCMMFSFVVGMQMHSAALMAAALASCALSALAEALSEALAALSAGYPYSQAKPSAIAIQNIAAVISWVVTATTVIFALYALIGGA